MPSSHGGHYSDLEVIMFQNGFCDGWICMYFDEAEDIVPHHNYII